MEIYGYARICSEGGYRGKESDVLLFSTAEARNEAMYEDYSQSFNAVAENEEFDSEDSNPVDANGNEEMSKSEFMKEIADSKDPEHDVFGLIQASDYHVQFEPFCRRLEDFAQTSHENVVLKGLEKMREYDGHGNGLQYSLNGRDYTVDQMIEEISNNTEAGRAFSQNVYDTILTYMGKFSQDAD